MALVCVSSHRKASAASTWIPRDLRGVRLTSPSCCGCYATSCRATAPLDCCALNRRQLGQCIDESAPQRKVSWLVSTAVGQRIVSDSVPRKILVLCATAPPLHPANVSAGWHDVHDRRNYMLATIARLGHCCKPALLVCRQRTALPRKIH